jgi:hypothetical protein
VSELGSSGHTGWTVRAVQLDDLAQVVDLFATCFGRRISVEHLRWKLHSHPGTVEHSWLAEVDGRIIAHFAGYPVRLWLDRSEHPAVVLVDGMVDPEFRRRGVITSVVTHARQRWTEAGVSLGLLLPNEQWGSRVGAFSWQPLFPLRWRRLTLRPSIALARRTRFRSLGRLRFLDTAMRSIRSPELRTDEAVSMRPLSEAGPELDEVWCTVRSAERVSLVRDRSWVSWRYLTSPTADYRVLLAEKADVPVGYVAYRLIREAGGRWATLADLCTDPGDPRLVETLLAGTIRDLVDLEVESVSGLAIPETPFDEALHRAGFVVSRGSFDLHVVSYGAELPTEMLRNPRHWLLSGGDFDVV